jgi:hypothetical protein
MRSAFDEFLKARFLTTDALTAEDLLDSMAGWYLAERVGDADSIDRDGDMLLVQWGRWDWIGEGNSTWQFDITRQAMAAAEEIDDQEMWQFSVRLHFADSPESRRIEESNRWCRSPADIDDWHDFVRSSAAFSYAAGRPSLSVESHNGEV